VTVEWRKLHNEELNELYSLPNSIIFIIKSIYCSEFFGTDIHLDTRISKMFPLAILNELCLVQRVV
jgi:hypothetical protein